MANQAPEYLSAEELRNRLYHSLRNRGLVDSLKSQLRNSLVTELQQSLHGPLTLKDLKVPEGGSLLHRASNSLVANHLRACRYEYTLSVFLPECGLSQDKKFDTVDLLKLLNISPQSRLYQRLNSQTQQDSKKGFLWQLLSEVSALHANSSSSTGCQTDLIKIGPITPIDEKLLDVDELYSSRREDFLRTGRAGAEERLLSFQRQLEDRYNTQLKLELARIRDAEIATIRMEEKENSRRSLEQARRDLERIYKDKHDALVQRERNALERLQQQTEIQERETYNQRQTILEEIESVRQREAEVKREAEVNRREKKLSEDRVRDKETELRRRELEIKQKESSFEQRLQNEMAQFKLDQQAKYIERIQNLETREAIVKEGERLVSEEKARLQQLKDELRDKTQRVNELETLLSEARFSEVNANKNNEFLNAKLRDMSDYKTLKEQVVLYRNELETVRTRLAEVLSMNERERGRQEELLRELRRPSPESLMLQRDLERAKESLRQEQIVFNQQKQLLEARLKEELDRNKDLLQNFEEQTLQMKEMNREIVDLRQHLHMTTRALNNEVYRKPNDEHNGPALNESKRSQAGHNTSRHPADFSLDNPLPKRSLRFEADTKDVYHGVDFDLQSLPQTRGGDFLDEDASSIDSADVIAHTKYRLKSLDQEAHNLEKVYHDFHCRMTNINALPAGGPTVSPQNFGKSGGHKEAEFVSPRQSPIMFDNPKSSTPYKQTRKAQDFNDSFAELGTHSHRQTKSNIPAVSEFDITAVADYERIDHDHDHGYLEKDDKRVKTGLITVDDLEQRPGSPGIIVVAESVSSGDEGKSLPVLKGDSAEQVSSTSAHHTALDLKPSDTQVDTAVTSTMLHSQPVSLDHAWRSQQEKTEEPERSAQKRQQSVESELDYRQERLNKEQFDQEREAERSITRENEAKNTAAVEEEEEDKIDPVMRKYMAMVQEQKEREKEQLAKKTANISEQPLDKTPSISEAEDFSAAAEDKSEQGDDFW